MKRILVLFLLTTSLAPASAQVIFGWSAGWASLQELNREIYIYNAVNRSGLTKEMQPVHFNHGVAFGFRIPSEVFFELIYTRKRALVSSEFDSSGIAFERQLKVLSNTWNFGFGVQNEVFAVGISWDLGRFKGRGRRGPASSIGDQEYKELWTLDNTKILGISAYKMYSAATLFAEFKVKKFLGIRAYYQLGIRKNQMDGLDPWLFGEGNYLNFYSYQQENFSSFGIMLSLQIGGMGS